MSRFYAKIIGNAKKETTGRGNNDIRVAAMSWNGSVITTLSYDQSGELIVDIETSEDSASSGRLKFRGTFEEFKRILEGANA